MFLIPPTIWPGLDEKFNGCHERFSCAWSFNIGMSLIITGMGFCHFCRTYHVWDQICWSICYLLYIFCKKHKTPASSYQLNALQYRRMDFEEFCAAALSVHQLEALDRWEQHARCAYELFEKDGNRAIMIEELASVSAFLQSISTVYRYGTFECQMSLSLAWCTVFSKNCFRN